MTDISKCTNGCKKQEACYRWTAPSSHWQAYMSYNPDKNGECADFYCNSCREYTCVCKAKTKV